MMNEASPGFLVFKESVEGPILSPEAMGTYNLVALAEIRQEEKAVALQLLEKTIRKGDDPRVVDALIELQTEEATQVLTGLLARDPGFVTLRAGMRAWERFRQESALDAISRCIDSGNLELKELGLRVLGRLDAPMNPVLFRFLTDPVFDLRCAAKEALFFKYGLDRFDNLISSRVYHLSLGVTGSFERLYRDAAAQLIEMVHAIAEECAPFEMLDLSAGPTEVSPGIQRLWAAVDESDAPLNTDLLAALTDEETDYAVEYLTRAIQRGDMRVVPLLKGIDTPRSRLLVQVVEEELSSAEGL